MNYTSKGTVDEVSGDAFKRKSDEELAKNNYRDPSETSRSNSRLRGGVIELNKMSTIEAKLDTIMNRMSNQEKRGHSCNEVGTVEEAEWKCVANEGLSHEGPYQVEEFQYLNENRSYNLNPNNNLPTHYTPTLRNHENFSYGGGMQQGSRPVTISSRIMLNLGSKDNSNKAARDQTVKDKGDPRPLKIKC